MAVSSLLLLRLAEYLRARKGAIAEDAAMGASQDRKTPPAAGAEPFPWNQRVAPMVQATADALLALAAAPEGVPPCAVTKAENSATGGIQLLLSEAWLVRNSFYRAINRFQGEQSGKKVDYTALDMREARQGAIEEFDRLVSRAVSEWITGTTRSTSVPAAAVRDLYDGMRAIQGLLQLASDMIPAGAKTHVAVAAQQLQRLAARAQELTESDPDPGSPKAGITPAMPAPAPARPGLNMAPLDVPTFVRSVAEASRPAVQKKGLRLECLCNPGPQVLRTDGAKLHRATTLLLNYAVSCTEQGEVSVVSGEGESGGWTLEIRDSSAGVPPELLAKLLRGAAHAPDDASPANDATLGIALARDLAELLGGSLQASSEPGDGNSFLITLPVG